MSLHATPIGPVPEETARVARAAFPKGTLCLRIRDALDTIYEDELFADLFSQTGQPAEAAWRLALVCILQFLEDLSDRQAAETVRARIDWKYLLNLELTDAGFDFTVLTEFRSRVLSHQAGQRLLDHLLEQLSNRGWSKKRGVQRTDSTHVLAAVRRLNRLELVGETLRAALNVVAAEAPDWLKAWVPLRWFERYSQRIEEWRFPRAKRQQEQVMEQIGQDGSRLLPQIWNEQAPVHLRHLPEVERLRRTWVQQFFLQDGGIHLRNTDDLSPAHLTIRSPYDHEAHYGHKRDLSWFGYKVLIYVTCITRKYTQNQQLCQAVFASNSALFAGFSGNHEVEYLLECSRTELPPPTCPVNRYALLWSSLKQEEETMHTVGANRLACCSCLS